VLDRRPAAPCLRVLRRVQEGVRCVLGRPVPPKGRRGPHETWIGTTLSRRHMLDVELPHRRMQVPEIGEVLDHRLNHAMRQSVRSAHRRSGHVRAVGVCPRSSAPERSQRLAGPPRPAISARARKHPSGPLSSRCERIRHNCKPPPLRAGTTSLCYASLMNAEVTEHPHTGLRHGAGPPLPAFARWCGSRALQAVPRRTVPGVRCSAVF